MLKKIFSLLLAIIIITCVSVVAVNAENEFEACGNVAPYGVSTTDESATENNLATLPQGGDDVNLTYYVNLKTPEKLEDVQATIQYNSNVLEVVSCDVPNLINPVVNYRDLGYIYFNALDIVTGMDFTEDNLLIQVEFNVIGEGEADISISFVEMNAYYSEKYFYFGEQLNPDVIVTEKIASSATTPTTVPATDATSATEKADVSADIVETGDFSSYILLPFTVISFFAVLVIRKSKKA